MKNLLTFVKILLILILTFVLTSCGNQKSDALEAPERFRLESGGTYVGLELVTDRETGVQYILNTHSGGMTMLVDKDGKPYIANGWRDYGGED